MNIIQNLILILSLLIFYKCETMDDSNDDCLIIALLGLFDQYECCEYYTLNDQKVSENVSKLAQDVFEAPYNRCNEICNSEITCQPPSPNGSLIISSCQSECAILFANKERCAAYYTMNACDFSNLCKIALSYYNDTNKNCNPNPALTPEALGEPQCS